MTAPMPESPKLYGVIVMSNTGDTVWIGWLEPLANVPMAKLCQTVSTFFKKEGENQNSSYLDAGSFAAASTTDGDNIVTVICSLACPETEVLLKAREISHAIKLLYGTHLRGLNLSRTPEFAESTDLFQLLQGTLNSSVAGSQKLAPAAREWLNRHGSHTHVATHIIDKLGTISPCALAFNHLEQVQGFICAHFIDVTDPGEVLLSHWQSAKPSASSPKGSPVKAGTMGRLRTLSRDVMSVIGGSRGNRSSPATIASVQQLMARPISSLWVLIMRESRNLALIAAQSRRTTTVRGSGTETGTDDDTCTIDLSAMVADAMATISLVQLQHYEAAFVVLYTVPGGGSKGKASDAPFQVSHGRAAVPPALLPHLQLACQDIKRRFPITRDQLLLQVWPELPIHQHNTHSATATAASTTNTTMQAAASTAASSRTEASLRSTTQDSSAPGPSHASVLQSRGVVLEQDSSTWARPQPSFMNKPNAWADQTSVADPGPSQTDAIVSETTTTTTTAAATTTTASSGSTYGRDTGKSAERQTFGQRVLGALQYSTPKIKDIATIAPAQPPPAAGNSLFVAVGQQDVAQSSNSHLPGAQAAKMTSEMISAAQPEQWTVGAVHADHEADQVSKSHVTAGAWPNRDSLDASHDAFHGRMDSSTLPHDVESDTVVQSVPHASIEMHPGQDCPAERDALGGSTFQTQTVQDTVQHVNRDEIYPVAAQQGSGQRKASHHLAMGTLGALMRSASRSASADPLALVSDTYTVRAGAASPGQIPDWLAHAGADDKENAPLPGLERKSSSSLSSVPVSVGWTAGKMVAIQADSSGSASVLGVLRPLCTATHSQAGNLPLGSMSQPRQPSGSGAISEPRDSSLLTVSGNILDRRTAQRHTGEAMPRPPDAPPGQRPPSPNISRRHGTSAAAVDAPSWVLPHKVADRARGRQQPCEPTRPNLPRHSSRHHQNRDDSLKTSPMASRQRRDDRDRRVRYGHDRSRRNWNSRSERAPYFGLASATDLLYASIEREEDRRWRMQMMYDSLALRNSMLPPSWGPIPSYQQQPVLYSPPALSQPPIAHISSPQRSPTRHTTVHVLPSSLVSSQPQPASPTQPTVITTPPCPPSAIPYDIWQLFNGQWYQLVSSGEWIPSASPPTQHANSTGLHHHPFSQPGQPGFAATPPVSPGKHTAITAPTSSPIAGTPSLQLARDIASELWHELQRYIALQAQATVLATLSPTLSFQGNATSSQRHGSPHAAQWFMDPAGQLYYRSMDHWYQINPALYEQTHQLV